MFEAIHRAGVRALVFVVAVASAAAAVGLVTARPAAAATMTTRDGPFVYADAAGDSKSAPDITKVTLTSPSDGVVAFDVSLGSVQDLAGDAAVVVAIDSDRNPATGGKLGAEFIVGASSTGAGLLRWDGANFSGFDHQSISPQLSGGELTFTLTLGDLGVTTFDFLVVSVAGDDGDVAPESGRFTYPQAVAPTAPATPTTPTTTTPAAPTPPAAPVTAPAPVTPKIVSTVVPLGILFPKAGRVLRVRGMKVKLSTNTIVSPETVTCTLRLGRVQLAPLAGGCAWLIPKSYRKKRLSLTIVTTYRGSRGSLTLPVVPE
jgi:hypothetical protein